MPKILLIKTGAAGDIVRSTVLLNVLAGPVTWVIDDRYQHILPQHHPALTRIVPLSQAGDILRQEVFDQVFSLEEDRDCARLAGSISTQKLTGIYIENDQLSYTPDSSAWFNLSLYSKLGRPAANEAKWQNTASFQQLMFRMLDRSFNNEPYCIYRNPAIQTSPGLVGIETRAGSRWANKAWSGYSALIQLLERDGYRCLQLQQRERLTAYLDDIARCAFLISGDTLAMHVAMAYGIPSIAIFNCTSPAEIHDYGTLQKVVSPLLRQAFYRTDHDPEVIGSVTVEEVYASFVQHPLIKALAQKA